MLAIRVKRQCVKNMEQIEAHIRDHLVNTLDILEDGLEYVEKEKYLPHDLGTRGFIDILAKDKDDRWVIIELKRSKAASREALHEVLKYIEGFKNDRSVREHEIRVMIVSTEWRELIVPFSSFVSRTTCNVEGISLVVDSSNKPVQASRVEPIPTHAGRVFSPWHELSLYEDRDSLKRGRESYEHASDVKGVSDYVLVEMTPHASHRDQEIDAMLAAYEAMGMDIGENRESIAKKLPVFERLLYYAPLIQSAEFCEDVIREHAQPEDLHEFLDYISDMEPEERLGTLHEKVYEVGPDIHRDHFEIAYPAKFGSKLLDAEGWTIDAIHRYGGLAANELLDDAVIISELRGNDGTTGQSYNRSVSTKNRAELAATRDDIRSHFADNAQLSQQLIFCLDDAAKVSSAEFFDIRIYNPSHITLSIYLESVSVNAGEYVPKARIAVLDKDHSLLRLYCASLGANGRTPSFSHLLNTIYDGSPEQLTANLNWGGYDSKDNAICEEIGLHFVVYRFESDPNDGERLDNFRWIGCEVPHPLDGFFDFVSRHDEFVDDIVQLYSSVWNGFMVTWDNTMQFSFKT